MEKYSKKKRTFAMVFIHLENAYDRDPKGSISNGYKSKKASNGIRKANTGYVRWNDYEYKMCVWRDEGFYGESKYSTEVGIESVFVFAGNECSYEKCT